MELKSFIQKNKVFSFFTFLFLTWIVILVILSITANRVVTFYDWLDGESRNARYSSEIPLLRYFIEPLIAFNLMFSGYGAIIPFIYTMVLFRIVYMHLKKKGYFENDKAKLMWYPFRDVIRFAFIVISIAVISGLLLVDMIFIFGGFFYVNLYFMAILQIFMFTALALIVCYSIIIIVKYYHPKLKLNYGSKKRYNPPEPRNKREKYSRIFRKEFVYIVGIAFLLAGISMLSLTIHYPMHTIEADIEDDEVLLDFHVHTYYSDGWLSPEERVDWYIAHGIDGAAFSDHDNLRGAAAAKKYVKENNLDFTVFWSEEWTDHDHGIHMNIFGLEETVVPLESEVEGGPKAMVASETIRYVKDEGGYVIVNHYNYHKNPDGGYGVPYSLESLMKWGVDGFEICNGGNGYPEEIRDFCIENDLACISVSDQHNNKEMNSFTMVEVPDGDDFDLDDVFKSLKKNEHDCVGVYTNTKSVRLHDLFYALELDYVDKFMEYLLNLNTFQVLSWIAWSCGGYALLYYGYKRAKGMDIKKLQEKLL